jgi:hypothetical protein
MTRKQKIARAYQEAADVLVKAMNSVDLVGVDLSEDGEEFVREYILDDIVSLLRHLARANGDT